MPIQNKHLYLYRQKQTTMKTARKQYTNEELKTMLALEIEKFGGAYTDRRKTIEEMLRMRGEKI